MPLDLSIISNWTTDQFIVKNVSNETLMIGDLKILLAVGSQRDLLEQNTLTKRTLRTFNQIAASRHLQMLINTDKIEIYDENGLLSDNKDATHLATYTSKYDVLDDTLKTSTITEDYIITAGDNVILCNGTMTVTLPPAEDMYYEESEEAKILFIKNIGTGIVTVDGYENETIDEGSTAVIEDQYEAIRLTNDGSNYWIL